MVTMREASRRASCTGKTRYDRFSRAERAAHNSARAYAQRMQAYKCVYCNAFHIGEPKGGAGHDSGPTNAE